MPSLTLVFHCYVRKYQIQNSILLNALAIKTLSKYVSLILKNLWQFQKQDFNVVVKLICDINSTNPT